MGFVVWSLLIAILHIFFVVLAHRSFVRGTKVRVKTRLALGLRANRAHAARLGVFSSLLLSFQSLILQQKRIVIVRINS